MSAPANYKIEYECLGDGNHILKTGTIIAKRKISEFDALAGTENYLKLKVPGMVKMKCKRIQIDTMLGFIPTDDMGGRFEAEQMMRDFFSGFK